MTLSNSSWAVGMATLSQVNASASSTLETR